jgi:hypothetical protein
VLQPVNYEGRLFGGKYGIMTCGIVPEPELRFDFQFGFNHVIKTFSGRSIV